MSAYNAEKLIVDPQEAVKISGFMDAFFMHRDVFDLFWELHKLIPYKDIMGSERVRMARIAGALWTAGRIQGIREERERRRR